METTHIPGTLYPLGAPPHLPTMCSHRTGRRYPAREILCYEPGAYELAYADGSQPGCATIQTAEGPMPHLRCKRHVKGWAESYALDAQGRRVIVRERQP